MKYFVYDVLSEHERTSFPARGPEKLACWCGTKIVGFTGDGITRFECTEMTNERTYKALTFKQVLSQCISIRSACHGLLETIRPISTRFETLSKFHSVASVDGQANSRRLAAHEERLLEVSM